MQCSRVHQLFFGIRRRVEHMQRIMRERLIIFTRDKQFGYAYFAQLAILKLHLLKPHWSGDHYNSVKFFNGCYFHCVQRSQAGTDEDEPADIARPHECNSGAEVSERTLVPGDNARLGETRFETWLTQSAAKAAAAGD